MKRAEEDRVADLKEANQITKEPSIEDKQPAKQSAAKSFTWESVKESQSQQYARRDFAGFYPSKDSLRTFVEDKHSNKIMADPDTSPPASKKRRESQRELGTREKTSEGVNAATIIDELFKESSLGVTENAHCISTPEFPHTDGASIGESTSSESVSDYPDTEGSYGSVSTQDSTQVFL